MNFENKLEIGTGCYTASEISKILHIPYSKVHTWMNKYWDGRLGAEFGEKYSWTVDNSKAVSFHTLVEFYVLIQLAEAGVSTKKVLEAHKELSTWYNSAFPFAIKEVLDSINTDGTTVYLTKEGNTISLDGTRQLNLAFIQLFFKKLDFGADQLASRFWPMGKMNSILIDPQRKFGQPVIDGKNIYPETVYNLFKGGDAVNYIAYLYDLSEKEVKDAIKYCDAA